MKSHGLIAILFFVSGCTNIPGSMKIDGGSRPNNIDDFVRFRTTLYFRTFDYCLNKEWRKIASFKDPDKLPSSDVYILPDTDTLYRFRMTGKAVSGTTQVRFESGTLDASVIDPFGAVIERNPDTGRPQFVSQSDLEQRNRTAEARRGFDRLLRLLGELPEESASDEFNTSLQQVRTKILNQMETAVEGYGGVNEQTDPEALIGSALLDAIRTKNADVTADDLNSALTPLLELIDGSERREASSTQVSSDGSGAVANRCANGVVRRGYQIMGPEGWRTFNQDERLIMAMSSSAAPLIQSLQRVSNNVLNARASDSDLVLPLVQESLVIQTAESTLSNVGAASEDNIKTTLEEVKNAFTSN